jgi:hypothetical protein
VDQLRSVSPATVCRCSLVHFDDDLVGWQSIVESAIGQLPDGLSKHGDMLLELYKTLFDSALHSVKQFRSAALPEAPTNAAHVHVRLMDAILSHHFSDGRRETYRRSVNMQGTCSEHSVNIQ